MQFFEYPYVIITILAIIIFLMGIIGLYFTMKSVKTSKGSAQKGFCGIGRIEIEFDKVGNNRKNRSLVYISVDLENMKRLYFESKAIRMTPFPVFRIHLSAASAIAR